MKLLHKHLKEEQTVSEKIVHLNEEVIKNQISESVIGSAEETQNELFRERG